MSSQEQSSTLESDLLTHLSNTPALEDLHATLLSSLQRLGWTEKIRRLTLELLRANRCERFDEVVEAVVASAQGRRHPALYHDPNSNSTGDDGAANGNGNGNGDATGIDGGGLFSFENVDVRIPEAVVEQGVRALKDVLREVVILDDDGDSAAGRGGVDQVGEGDKVNGESSPAKKEKKIKSGKQAK